MYTNDESVNLIGSSARHQRRASKAAGCSSAPIECAAAGRLPAWAFGRVAPILEAQGFEPIPIRGKAAFLDRWTLPRPVATHLPEHAGCNTGLLTSNMPTIDIDVRVLELAEALADEARALAGDAPERIGQPPKRALIYRTDAPFAKLATPEFILPGDQPGDKAHKVEILGDGQQLATFGIHPGTGREYFWLGDSPLDLEWQDLRVLTAEIAVRIIAMADAMLRKAGGRPKARSGCSAKPLQERLPGPPPRQVRGMDEARQVVSALRRINPSQLGYDDWIWVGYGVKGAFGEQGRDLWFSWSAASIKDVPDYTAETWRWIKPDRCGWRFVIRLAEVHGHA